MLLYGFKHSCKLSFCLSNCYISVVRNFHFCVPYLLKQTMLNSWFRILFDMRLTSTVFFHGSHKLFLHRGFCSLASCSACLKYSAVEEGMFTSNLWWIAAVICELIVLLYEAGYGLHTMPIN